MPDKETEQSRRPKHRKKHRVWWKILLVVAVCAGLFLLFTYRESFASDSVLIWIDNVLSGNNGGRGFPVDFSGGTVTHMEATSDGYLAVLTDTGLCFYNNKGVEEVRRSHGFSTPGMRVAGRYVLLIENGGHRLRLETRARSVIELTTTYDILTASVAENGYVAVLTASNQSYTSELIVYDTKGNEKYHRYRTEQGVNVALSPNGYRVAVTGAGVTGGMIYGSMDVYALSSDEKPLYSYRRNDVLMNHVDFIDDNTVAAVGTGEAWIADIVAGTTDVETFTSGEPIAVAANGEGLAVVLHTYGTTRGGTVEIFEKNGQKAYETGFDGAFIGIGEYQRGFLVLSEGKITFCGNTHLFADDEVISDGLHVAVFRSRVMVMGLTKLYSYPLPQ